MNSHSLSVAPGALVEHFPPLLPQTRPWQKWLSLGLSLALLTGVAWKLGGIGFANALRDVPGSPLFWIAFASYYFALPASEFLIFKRLWNIPRAGFKALIRKLIFNEILFGYSGEAYFYTWARRHARLAAAPFGAIKDVSILSAVAGNLITLIMLVVAWPQLGNVVPGFHGQAVLFSAAVLLGLSLTAFLFRRRIFSLPVHQLRMIFAIHIARLLATLSLSGLMWKSALPDIAIGWLVILATLQLLVSRLPFVPNKDLAFALIALYLTGQNGAIGPLIGTIAILILLAHFTCGSLIMLGDIKAGRKS